MTRARPRKPASKRARGLVSETAKKRADRDRSYAEDIVDAAKHIATYLASTSFHQFLASPMVQDAVLRRLTIIGEAAACVSDEFQVRNPEVSWREIVALRNLVVHKYWSVDRELVWRIASEDVPALLAHLGRESEEA